jgi:hypothetical protein
VNFIIAHLGSFTDNWKAHQQVIYQLARYPNVYADTSGVRQFDYLVEAVKTAGAGKILFGSDGPWLHPGVELHKIRLLGLPRDSEARILGGNALRLLQGAGIRHAWSNRGRRDSERRRENYADSPQSAEPDYAFPLEPVSAESEYKL